MFVVVHYIYIYIYIYFSSRTEGFDVRGSETRTLSRRTWRITKGLLTGAPKINKTYISIYYTIYNIYIYIYISCIKYIYIYIYRYIYICIHKSLTCIIVLLPNKSLTHPEQITNKYLAVSYCLTGGP